MKSGHLTGFVVASGVLLLAGCAATTEDGVTGSASPAITAVGTTPDAGAATTAGLALSVHTTLGIPEAASVNDAVHALLVKPQYVTSFDSTRKNPRWTSWELTTKWIGSTGRTGTFNPDPQLPAAFPQASGADYTNSGFQRGHICPSGDRTDTVADNGATFVFTNAVPQTAASNTGTWETLEVDERSLAEAGSHLFIVAGSIYADTKTIGNGVAVPTSMFKIVVVLAGASPLPSDVTAQTRVISVEIPNTTTVSGSYKSYRVKFADLEAKTGFHFLSDVAPSVHDALAEIVDAN